MSLTRYAVHSVHASPEIRLKFHSDRTAVSEAGRALPHVVQRRCLREMRGLTAAGFVDILSDKRDKKDKRATITGPLDQNSGQAENALPRPSPQALDAAREFIRARVRTSSVRRVAAESGIGKSVIEKFADGITTPHPRNAQALVEYHLRHSELEGAAEAGGARTVGWRANALQVEAARGFVRARVDRSSIRRVAAESGISKGVIAKFVNGAAPHPANAQELVEYHVRSQGPALAEVERASAVPDARLREFFSEEYRRVRSLRRVAKAAGVTYGALEGFLGGAKATQPRVRHKLAAHYLARDGSLSEPRSPATQDAQLPRPGLEEARQFIRGLVNVSGVSSVARAIGPPVTPKVLENFIAGSVPRAVNAEALVAFHTRTQSTGYKPAPPPATRRRRSRSAPRTQAKGDAPLQPPGLEEAREFIRGLVHVSGPYSVARAIGPPLTPRVVENFIAGSLPRVVNAEALIAFHTRTQSTVHSPEAPPAARRRRKSDGPNDADDELAAVRELVRYRVQREPLRIIVDETGVSTHSLQNFLRGRSTPQPSYCEKLLRWYNALSPEARVVPPAPDATIDEEEPDVDFMRQLVAQRQKDIGMYLLGDELGVSTTPIRDFVSGSPPKERTWEKLVAWYRVRKAAGLAVLYPKPGKEIRFQPPGDTPCRAAMGILMDAFPRTERRAVRRRVLELLAVEHQNAGRELPEWITALLTDHLHVGA